ncbi:DUF1627 domain-containing protein [Salmonella enterica]|nr:DUF1627 domain-containing protein [Salmonella enterica]
MESVLDALKAMGKVSSVELAARLGMKRQQVISELWELHKAGVVTKNGLSWELSEDTGEMPAPKVTEQHMLRAIGERGALTSDELAALFGVTSRKVASTLAMAISKGRLIRVNQNGKFRYCIPDDNLPAEPKVASVAKTHGKAFPQPADVVLPVQEATTQEEIKTATVADIVQSLPSFAETRANDLILPSLHVANRELRRAKSHVQKWERVCAALRELNKPGSRRLLARLSQQGE